MARRVWLAGWASHRLELTATSPLIDLCTPVGKHTRGRPGKSRSCDGQGRRSVVTDKAGDHVTQHDARPALARSAPTHQAPVGYSPPWCSAHVRSLFPRFDLFPRGILNKRRTRRNLDVLSESDVLSDDPDSRVGLPETIVLLSTGPPEVPCEFVALSGTSLGSGRVQVIQRKLRCRANV